MGISFSQIKKSLSQNLKIAGRFEFFKENNKYYIIYFGHTPNGIKATLLSLNKVKKRTYQPAGRRMRGHLTYGVWLYLKNGSQKGWWSSGLISFDDIAVLVTDDINTDLDDFVIEEAGPQYVLRWWNSPTARVGRSGETIRQAVCRPVCSSS